MKKFGGMPNMNNVMKQAQKMQKKMEKKQKELKGKEITATAGGGVVEVVITGEKEIKSISIDPVVVDSDDVETLEDLVMAAVNEGMRQAEELSSKEMSKLTGGMDLPGGMF